ncbi:ion channel [Brevundimonas sp.]|uniref:ion channel n=1 Tax=Brevundimonas sp. TaxID=1871086 RepID=UPI00286AD074|nr:ion channel [Brevundimonas sp.]
MTLLIRATNGIAELLLACLVLLVLCAGLYSVFEHRAYGDALCWAAVTATTTTSYGDISPTSLGGRIVALVLMRATLLFIRPLLIGRVIGAFLEDRRRFTDEEQRQLMADIAELKARLARDDPPGRAL